MAFKSAELTIKKRKLDNGDAQPVASVAAHTHIVIPGTDHDTVRQVVAEGEQVLSSQGRERKTFRYEDSTFVITGPNKQVLVAYDPANQEPFWNEVTDQNFITAHLEHHPNRMETFVQDINKTYVQLTKDDAKEVLKKVLGSRRIPYATAVKTGNRNVQGSFVYAVVPPVLYNEYVSKQKKTAKRLNGGGEGPQKQEGAGDEKMTGASVPSTPTTTTADKNNNTNGQPTRRGRGGGGGRRGGRGRGRGGGGGGGGSRAASQSNNANAMPMDTNSDEKADKQASPSPAPKPRYKALSMSPTRSTASPALPEETELSESQSQSISRINSISQSLLAICTPLAHELMKQVTDEYLEAALEQYQKTWDKCTTYVQLKQNMLARREQIGAKYSVMDDLMWLFMLTNPQLVRALRNRIAHPRTVTVQSGKVPRHTVQETKSD